MRRRSSSLALDHAPRSGRSAGLARPLRGERPAPLGRATRQGSASAAAPDEGALFTPNVLLPQQCLSGFRVAGPEARLMLAVLRDGINCFRKYASAQDPEGRQMFADVRDWLNSDDHASPFAFENLCDAFEISPGWVRRHLLTWQRRGKRTPSRRAAIAVPPRGARTRAAIAAPRCKVRAGRQ